MKLYIKKSRFSEKSRFKELMRAGGDCPLNRGFTVQLKRLDSQFSRQSIFVVIFFSFEEKKCPWKGFLCSKVEKNKQTMQSDVKKRNFLSRAFFD